MTYDTSSPAFPEHPGRTLACLFDGAPWAEAPSGQFSYHPDDDPGLIAEELMASHELVDNHLADRITLEAMLMSTCCDGFFEYVRNPILASMHRTCGPEIAEDLVDLVDAAERVARWKGQSQIGFLELSLLDLFDIDGLRIILPAIERLVGDYRDRPFDIHNHEVLDQMVSPFVRFFETLKPDAKDDQLRAFVMDGIRGRWPVTEDEMLASIARVTSKQ